MLKQVSTNSATIVVYTFYVIIFIGHVGMRYNSKKVCTILLIVCLVMAIAGSTFAHSGRTDLSGG